MILSAGELLKAQRLRQEGKTWNVISREVGQSVDRLRSALDGEWREHRRQLKRERRFRDPDYKAPPNSKLKNLPPVKRMAPPPDVLAERDRVANLQYRPLTAILLGDPPPSRSALDQKIREGKYRDLEKTP